MIYVSQNDFILAMIDSLDKKVRSGGRWGQEMKAIVLAWWFGGAVVMDWDLREQAVYMYIFGGLSAFDSFIQPTETRSGQTLFLFLC
jgi:hypothetical protein